MRLLPWLPRPKRRDLTMSNTLQYRDDPRAYRPVSGAFVAVAREPKWVELRGLEPLTPTLPVWCATSCATAPCRPGLVCPSRRQPYRPGDRVPAGGPSPRATCGRRRRPPARARTATPERGPSGSGRRSRGHLRDPDVVTE